MSDHSFIAFIDESGHEGDPEKAGASEFLIISAVVVRAVAQQSVTDVWDLARRHAKKSPTWDWKSFKDISSPGHKFLISRLISDLPVKIVAVIAHKPTINYLGKTGKFGDLYFYLSHLLLERISWVCRETFPLYPSGDGTVKIIFSERANLRMDTFAEYVTKIKVGESRYFSNVAWDFVDLANIHTRRHKDCDGLRIADFVASSFGSAIEYKQFDLTDDRYIIQMRRKIFSLGREIKHHGIKLFPPECEGPLPMEPRMRWLNMGS
ncbi:DUF3800 domain-containing protein [Methylobacterium sp. NPDC080182]|uniref:DUF3800 domain-containing protein n=1 Tax=Methylobacterium sp. NPDC080182 TaxID=3390590 RepID=UPI003D04A645